MATMLPDGVSATKTPDILGDKNFGIATPVAYNVPVMPTAVTPAPDPLPMGPVGYPIVNG